MRGELLAAAAAGPRHRGAGVSPRFVSVFMAALLAAGCSAGEPVEQFPGRMIASYDDATTPEAIRGRAMMQNSKLLEGLAADVNDSLKLPRDIALIGQQCGQANAGWNKTENRIRICYELADLNLRLFDKDPNDGEALGELSQPAAYAAAVDALYAVFFHELGHAVISLYDLPFTGREEDVADQLSAFVVLEADDFLTDFPDAARVMEAYAAMFDKWAALRGTADASDFAEAHSLNESRMFNLRCWIYGSDPAAHAHMIADGSLPEARAAGCPEEYQQLRKAWSTLLAPYIVRPN